MKLVNYVLIFIAFSVSALSDSYYSFGEKIELTPTSPKELNKKHIYSGDVRNQNKLYFLRGEEPLAIDRELFIGFKAQTTKNQKDKILKSHRLTLKKVYTPTLWLVATQKTIQVLPLVNALHKIDTVKYAHPNFYRNIKNRTLPTKNPYTNPKLKDAWHLNKTDDSAINPAYNLKALSRITMGRGIKIGIIDDGLYADHEDLKDNIAQYVSASTLSSNPSFDPLLEAHGTQMSGNLIARNNDKGSMGIASEAKLYFAKHNATSSGMFQVSEFLNAFEWMGQQKVDIISNSWGSYQADEALARYIQAAILQPSENHKAIPVVFAAGNQGTNLDKKVIDESEIEGVIGVGGVSKKGNELSKFSDYGAHLDIATVSEAIITPNPPMPRALIQTLYAKSDGVSHSAALTSGVIALMQSIDPYLSPAKILNIIHRSSQIKATTKHVTLPVLNPLKALKLTLQEQTLSSVARQLEHSSPKNILGTFDSFDFRNAPSYLDWVAKFGNTYYQLLATAVSDDNPFGFAEVNLPRPASEKFYLINRFGLNDMASTEWVIVDKTTTNTYLMKMHADKLTYQKVPAKVQINDNLVSFKAQNNE